MVSVRITLREVACVALGALVLGAACVTFIAEDASAHGTCVNSKTSPVKTAGGRVSGTNQYDCSPNSHARTTGCAQIVREESGGNLVAAGPINCRTAGSAQRSPRVTATAPCRQTGWYRTLGSGAASNANGELVHNAADYSLRQFISCSTSDLISTAGVFEDINALLGGLTTSQTFVSR